MNPFSCLSLFSLYCFTISCLPQNVYAKESAWNGYTPAESSTEHFMSYYVPPGAKGYPATSPLVHYKGDWKTDYSPSFPHKTVRSTCQKQASVSFAFNGTAIEWFGNCDQRHGNATVYIDSKRVFLVNTYCNSTYPQVGQRQYSNYDLTPNHRTFTIVNEDGCITIVGFVVTRIKRLSSRSVPRREQQDRWTFVQKGSTGVNAMQLTVLSPTYALAIDKVEHNPLTLQGRPVWASLYNLQTHDLTALRMQSNSFCAGGSFLSNGTFLNVGGNPIVEDRTNPADFGDLDGMQAIRLMEPCDTGDCSIIENHDRLRMASPRWYSTTLRIEDGSAMIIGGSKKGGWINNATVNNPTIEYYPPKNIHGYNGIPIPSAFLKDTLNSNLFPIAFALPDGRIFVAANNDAMIYDWKTNTEQRLPPIPNGVRVTYPMAGTGLLLPLSSVNNYDPEILLCGGSTIDDGKPGFEISSQDPASSQCSRILLTKEGIDSGWEVDHMPEARLMPDAVLIPTGEVVIVNGAGSGISGYGNVVDPVGLSNADKPVLTPCLYDPLAKLGSRFSSEFMPSSNIPRMYHSVATLTPSGSIMIAGSNPNLDRSEIEYGTEYRVEWLNPPYMNRNARPNILHSEPLIGFGKVSNLQVDLEPSGGQVKLVLMDHGFVTHAVHANSRMVYLDVQSITRNTMTFQGPPNGGVYPPGPGYLYVVVDGVPSAGVKVIVGDGKGPEVDHEALENELKSTQVDQYEKSKSKSSEDGSE